MGLRTHGRLRVTQQPEVGMDAQKAAVDLVGDLVDVQVGPEMTLVNRDPGRGGERFDPVSLAGNENISLIDRGHYSSPSMEAPQLRYGVLRWRQPLPVKGVGRNPSRPRALRATAAGETGQSVRRRGDGSLLPES